MMRTGIKQLITKYNIILRESQQLENDLDNKVLPYYEREYRITQLRCLTRELNRLIKKIKVRGYIPLEEELQHGFITSIKC